MALNLLPYLKTKYPADYNFIGAIRKGKTRHRLNIVDEYKEDYLRSLKAVNYQDYIMNKDCLCNVIPISSTAVFSSKEDVTFELKENKCLGDYELSIVNKSGFFLEVYRKSDTFISGVNGLGEHPIGVASPSSITTFYVENGDYDLRFLKLDPIRNKDRSITGIKKTYMEELSNLVAVGRNSFSVLTINWINDTK